MSLWDYLNEELKKPIYSKKEAELELSKSFSTTSKPMDHEHDHISYDPFASYSSTTLSDWEQQHSNRRDLIGKWRRVSLYPEVDEAINEITTDGIVYDDLQPIVELNLEDLDVSDKIKNKMIDSFNHIQRLMEFNKRGEELFRQWYVDGQLNLEVVYDNKKPTEGIQQLIVLQPFHIYKVKDEDTKEIKYVIIKNASWNINADVDRAEKVFKEEQITQSTSGLWSIDKRTPLSYINKAMKSINQLYLIEDSIVIYKITRAPEKRVFYIDTGNLPKSKAEEYIKSLITKYRQKKIYNAETGTIENRNKAISILEDFWLPRNTAGRGTQIDTLPGLGQGFEDMAPVDYFVDKVYKALNIPRSRRNEAEDRMVLGNNLEIERDELKFFRFVSKLRRRFVEIFVDLLKKDLIAKKVLTLQDWYEIREHIKFKWANDNEYSEIKNLQILEMRMAQANNAIPLQQEGMVSKEWIQRKILKFTDEDLKEIEGQIAKEPAPEGEEGDEEGGGGGSPFGFQSIAGDRAKDREEQQKQPELFGDSLIVQLSSLIKDEIHRAMAELREEQNRNRREFMLDNLKEGDRISNGDETYVYRDGRLILVTDETV